MRYVLHPCADCGRKISRGYVVDNFRKTVCGRCYKNYDPSFIDSVIKVESEPERKKGEGA